MAVGLLDVALEPELLGASGAGCQTEDGSVQLAGRQSQLLQGLLAAQQRLFSVQVGLARVQGVACRQGRVLID